MGQPATRRLAWTNVILAFVGATASGLGNASTTPKTLAARIEKITNEIHGTDFAWSFSLRISNPTNMTLAYCPRFDYYFAKIIKNGRRIAIAYNPVANDKLMGITVKDLLLVRPGESSKINVVMERGWFPKVEHGQMAIVFRGEAGLNRRRTPAERNTEFAKFFKKNHAEMCEEDFATNLIPLPTSAGPAKPKP